MISESEVRKLNNKGIDQFRKYLSRVANGSIESPPYHLLTAAETSVSIDHHASVRHRIFNSRLDAAKCLDEQLSGWDQENIETDVHLWSWLSLFYFDQVCPPDDSGKRKPGREYRHILEPGYPNGHRHLLCGPYMVYTTYGLNETLSAALLCTPIPVENSFHHQLAVRQSLITNKGIMEAVHMLYFDHSTGRPKRGSQMKKKTPGTLFRFIDVIQQLDLTYDLYSMSGKDIIGLLPPEFDKWK